MPMRRPSRARRDRRDRARASTACGSSGGSKPSGGASSTSARAATTTTTTTAAAGVHGCRLDRRHRGVEDAGAGPVRRGPQQVADDLAALRRGQDTSEVGQVSVAEVRDGEPLVVVLAETGRARPRGRAGRDRDHARGGEQGWAVELGPAAVDLRRRLRARARHRRAQRRAASGRGRGARAARGSRATPRRPRGGGTRRRSPRGRSSPARARPCSGTAPTRPRAVRTRSRPAGRSRRRARTR